MVGVKPTWKEPGPLADTRRNLSDSGDITLCSLVDCLRESSFGFLPPLFSLIDALSMGQGIIEGGGRFQPFTYDETPLSDCTYLALLVELVSVCSVIIF